MNLGLQRKCSASSGDHKLLFQWAMTMTAARVSNVKAQLAV